MKRISILLAALVLCAVSASATRISKNKAQAKAVSFFQKGLMKDLSKGAEVKLVKEYASSAKAPAAAFAFSSGKNVVFVSAEDKMPAILGYSSNADVNNLPPALEEMLRYYARLSDAVREGRIEAPKLYASETAVDSLLHTCWNQCDPFCSLCPTYEDEQLPNGCVSTALAQVLKYHNWPDKPEGKAPKYTTASLNKEIPEEDLQSHTYKWDDMINVYKEGTYTEEQAQAVSQLCYDISVASKMDFDSRKRTGSSTSLIAAANAMRTYFKYNKNMRIAVASHYSEAEWAAILKNEINQGRPLPYGGSKQAEGSGGFRTGGHCFVVDGYNTEGLFHVNWGWGGRSDGFFLITSLDPLEEGIGGVDSAGGFRVNQQTLLDFVPDRDGSTTAGENYVFEYNRCVGDKGDNILIMVLCNESLDAFHGDIVMQLVDKDGNVADQETVIKDLSCDIEENFDHLNVSLNVFDFSKFADGIYYIELLMVSKATGKEYLANHKNLSCRIIVENGKLKGVYDCAILEGKILGLENVVYKDRFLKLTAKGQAKNIEDFDFLETDGLKFVLKVYHTEKSFNEIFPYDIKKRIKPGETVTFEGDLEVGIAGVNPNEYDKLMVQVTIENNSGVVAIVETPFNEFVANGIKDIKVNKEGKSPAFSLDGKRVGDDYKGIIIKDKKKTLNN